ncbi:unnamed protein product [Orchesella dallaii]|uniref:Ionotropic glutamate receptor C-terminal domain-containing protein n=1 Tax=Orchesella dallaii TaxID=48710 RepID=A0ABP1PVP9_9HEXA
MNENSTNFGNITFRIATFVEAGVVDLSETPSAFQMNSTHFFTGTAFSILGCMQLLLGFRNPQVILAKSFLSNDRVNSIGNETIEDLLAAGQVDLAMSHMYYLESRAQLANALWPLTNEKFHAYFQQPASHSHNMKTSAFDKQFSPSLIIAFFSILLVSGCLISCFLTLNQWEWEEECQIQGMFRHIEMFFKNLTDALFWAVATFFQQGHRLPVVGWQERYLIILGGALSIGLFIAYCALTTAALLTKIVPIRNVTDMINFQYTFFAYEDARYRLLIDVDPKLVWKAPSMDLQKTKELSIRRIFRQRHAHLDTHDLFYEALHSILPRETDVCELLSVIRHQNGKLQAGYFARKGFQYRNDFNVAIGRLLETGMIKRFQAQFDKDRIVRCPPEKELYQENLGMSYVSSAFVGLGFAFAATVLILLVEYGSWRWKRYKLLYS